MIRNGPVLISGVMDLPRPSLLLHNNGAISYQLVISASATCAFRSSPCLFRRVMLTGVASETVETARAPLVTEPTRLNSLLPFQGNSCHPAPQYGIFPQQSLGLDVPSYASWSRLVAVRFGSCGKFMRAGCWWPVMNFPASTRVGGVVTAPRVVRGCSRIITAHSPTRRSTVCQCCCVLVAAYGGQSETQPAERS